MNYKGNADALLIAALVARSGGGVTPEEIQQAVENYLEQNPVTGELELDGTTITMANTEGGN